MQINLELNNQTKFPVKKLFLNAVIKETLNKASFNFLKNRSIAISFALVDKGEIKRLNRTYRKKNKVTDILSFSGYKSEKGMKSAVDKEIFLGELVLCYDYIKEYAKKENKNIENELANVTAHGILHLLGMRHGKKMFALQDKAVKSLNRKI